MAEILSPPAEGSPVEAVPAGESNAAGEAQASEGEEQPQVSRVVAEADSAVEVQSQADGEGYGYGYMVPNSGQAAVPIGMFQPPQQFPGMGMVPAMMPAGDKPQVAQVMVGKAPGAPVPPTVEAKAKGNANNVEAGRKEYATVGFPEIFKQFVLLGWTAFGGPQAHIALFQKLFLEDNLNWMSTGLFMELFALGQCLPGPTSTQVSFAIGLLKKGVSGGLLSGMLFQYPGLLMMSIIGFLAEKIDWENNLFKGFASGLGSVGVALVVGAAIGLSAKTAPDRETKLLNLIAAVVSYMYTSAWIFPALILFGGIVTYIRDLKKPVNEAPGDEGIQSYGMSKVGGACLILLWAVILVVCIVLRTAVLDYQGSAMALYWFETFYRIGSYIFGGGQVVLPLIVEQVVQYTDKCEVIEGLEQCKRVPDYMAYPAGDARIGSWMTEAQFLAGLGVAQAMPGPLFNISAYLGALIAARAGMNALAGIAACWFGMFAPGVLLIFGALPWWGEFRKLPVYRRALPGMNAAAVGLVVAASFSLYDKVRSASPFPDTAVAIGILGFAAVELFKAPAPAAIVGGGALGLIGAALKVRWIAG